jgi:murein DD-endopeptidase MepM/ murein hydrolase activator NlpD
MIALSRWWAHFVGIVTLWTRFAAPGALLAAFLGRHETVSMLAPWAVGPLAAALYAAGHGLLRLRPPPLARLKAADALILATSSLLAAAPVVALVAATSVPWTPLLPALSLMGWAWGFNWSCAPPASTADADAAPPLAWRPPAEGAVTAGFAGYDASHLGLDLGLPAGTPVRAPADGEVRRAGPWQHWGRCVLLDHGGGWTTLLAHLDQTLVGHGARVAQGEVIGLSGAGGIATGPHLHCELRLHGQPVNPTLWFESGNTDSRIPPSETARK